MKTLLTKLPCEVHKEEYLICLSRTIMLQPMYWSCEEKV